VSEALQAPSFECLALCSAHGEILSALFERSASGCYCEWWHFEGDKNAWLERLAHSPEKNRARLLERVQAPTLGGVVAVARTGEAVGYMKLTPAEAVPKLYAQRPYRGLPCLRDNREHTVTVGCFLVDAAWRRRGVASALLETGIELARATVACAVEAFPRRAEGLRDEEVWTGPHAVFLRSGFEMVHDLAQYPVLRRMLQK
jgi:GNAT superfamily N-acetyltransferase